MRHAGVPYYSDLHSQDALVEQLNGFIARGRVPHALLFTGEDGGEAMPLAIAFSRHLLCTDPVEGGPCGKCLSCRQMDQLEHPDLYPIFPIIKEGAKESVSADFMTDFREMVLSEKRFSEESWRERQSAGNKQLQILVSEAEQILHHTSLKSFSSRYQVILVWMPEKMRVETANKLLKILEEPPQGVVFLFVSHEPDQLLSTITSRLQRVMVPSITEPDLISYLTEEEGIDRDLAKEIGHLAQGNLYRALRMIDDKEGKTTSLFGETLELLALPISRDPQRMLAKSEELSQLSRPEILALIEKSPEVLRETLALRYGGKEVVYIPAKYMSQAESVSKMLSPERYPTILDDLQKAKLELRQNANVKLVFFDLFLNLAKHYARS
ncbi:MAG: hypothetical protein Q4D93_05595 [Porphyromonas sp.]|nr:hypothetical protein [Porphyromonas sp.]